MYLNDNAEFCGDGIRYYSICIYIYIYIMSFSIIFPCASVFV